MEYIEKFARSISLENLKFVLMKNSLKEKTSFFSRFDPRILILWYLIFSILPWFIISPVTLVALFLFICTFSALNRTSGFLILLMCIGVFGNLLAIGIAALFFGENDNFLPQIAIISLKFVMISLASISIFASMEAERISNVLLSVGAPYQICFGVSYGYRIMPVMIEEYNEIIMSFRMRSKLPSRKRKTNPAHWFYIIKISIIAFYPMILNTAKRTRTTVEVLETKGFNFSSCNSSVKQLKMASMKIRCKDLIFLFGSVFIAVLSIISGMLIHI